MLVKKFSILFVVTQNLGWSPIVNRFLGLLRFNKTRLHSIIGYVSPFEFESDIIIVWSCQALLPDSSKSASDKLGAVHHILRLC